MITTMHEGGQMMHDGGHMMSGWMAAYMVVWALLGLALIALVVVATVALVRRLLHDGHGEAGSKEILERRYAAGLIGRDEFLRQREDLSDG